MFSAHSRLRFTALMLASGLGMYSSSVMATNGMVNDVAVMVEQQNGVVIKGVVEGKNHEPLIGAAVAAVGGDGRAVTNMKGEYEIRVGGDVKKLRFSYIGYSPLEVDIDGRKHMVVTLSEDEVSLEEVVIVGYNKVKRGQITGSIDMVKGKEITDQTSASLEDRLQGKVSGLMISTGSGQPGSNDVKVRVRGTGSINGSNTPLYIMDGVMIEPAQFASLNNEDIQDIQVMKDASATAIYGSRGANGVIVITTKKGRTGVPRVTYNFRMGLSKLREPKSRMMTSEENIRYQSYLMEQRPGARNFPLMHLLYLEKKAADGSITPAEQMELDAGMERLTTARDTNTDWLDEMTRTGVSMEYNVSLSGGTDRTKYYVSGSYLDQKGALEGSKLERYSVRMNLDQKINNRVDFGLKGSVGFTDSDFGDPETGSNRMNWSNPWFTALLAYPFENPDNWYNGDNPKLITKYFTRNSEMLRIVGSTFLNVKILDGLQFKTNFGIDYYGRKNMSSLDRHHPHAQNNKGYLQQSTSDIRRYTWTNTLNFNKTFKDVHSVSGVGGFELFDGRYSGFNQKGFDLDEFMTNTPAGIGDKTGSSKFPPQIGGGKTHSNLMSTFTQWNYTYDDRYNVSASLRYDESSKFVGSNKGACFWSVGAAWDLRQESFMAFAERLNHLKLRASYGTTGNQDGIGDFSVITGYGKRSYNGQPGYGINSLGNPNLNWETSAQFDAGMDLRMFGNRLVATVDFYNKKTKDLLMYKKISQVSGFSNIQTNAGSVRNRGVELSIGGTPVRTENFVWKVAANITYNKNEILDLGTFANADNRFVDGDVVYEVGKPLGTWCMVEYAGVNPQTGEAWFADGKGGKTENIADAPAVCNFKSSEVPWFGGFNTSLSYKGLELSANFTYAFDYYIMNASKWFINNHNFNGNKPAYMLNMWREEGQVTDIPRFDAKNNPSPWASQFLEEGSFLKLKTVRLSYTPSRGLLDRLKYVSSLTVFCQGENLATFTSYSGQDPEVSGSTDYMSYPLPINVTFGVNLNF